MTGGKAKSPGRRSEGTLVSNRENGSKGSTAIASLVVSVASLIVVLGGSLSAQLLAQGPEEGIALAIVYDTSGSMADVVHGPGGAAPKYVIASRALSAIVDRLQTFVAAAPPESPRRMQVGLFVFADRSAAPAVHFGPFDAEALHGWMKRFSKPEGHTPLGGALRVAGHAVLGSNLTHKHVLVVTDGENTTGPEPAAVFPELKQEADRKQTSLAVHFVAFDVNAQVFDAMKKLGATVVGAADEQQLNDQLTFILERKILLEDEEVPTAGGAKHQ